MYEKIGKGETNQKSKTHSFGMKINLQPKVYSQDFHKLIQKTTKTNSQLCILQKERKNNVNAQTANRIRMNRLGILLQSQQENSTENEDFQHTKNRFKSSYFSLLEAESAVFGVRIAISSITRFSSTFWKMMWYESIEGKNCLKKKDFKHVFKFKVYHCLGCQIIAVHYPNVHIVG